MPYIYVIMWLAVGFILIFTAKKEGKIFYLAGGYFILLGIWWLLDILLDGIMLKGSLGIGFKIFTGVILAILLVFYIRHQREFKAAKAKAGDTADEIISGTFEDISDSAAEEEPAGKGDN